MKLFIVLLAIVGAYLYFLLYTTDIVLGQVTNLNNTYQAVAQNTNILSVSGASSSE